MKRERKQSRKIAVQSRAPKLDLDAMAKDTLWNDAPRFYFSMQAPLPGHRSGQKSPVSTVLWANRHAQYKTTPVGVYAYPLTPPYLHMLRTSALHQYKVELKGKPKAKLPYAESHKNVYFIEARDAGRMLFIPTHARGYDYYREQALGEMHLTKLNPGGESPYTIYKRLKRESQAEAGSYQYSRQLLKKLRQNGYTSVVDMGNGAIHGNEPTQAVFLAPSAFSVVAALTTKDLIAPYKRRGEASVVERLLGGGRDLRDANFSSQDLSRMNLRGKDFGGTNFTGANLYGANLRGVIWDETTIWPKGFKPPQSA